MEQPEVIIIGGALLKIIIDIFAPILPDNLRKYIPAFAVCIGILWGIFFTDVDFAYRLYFGASIWASAVWINELGSIWKSKPIEPQQEKVDDSKPETNVNNIVNSLLRNQ